MILNPTKSQNNNVCLAKYKQEKIEDQMSVIVDSIMKASMKLLSSDNLTMIFVAFNNFNQIFNSNNLDKVALSVSQIKEKNIVLYTFKENVNQSPVKTKNSNNNCLNLSTRRIQNSTDNMYKDMKDKEIELDIIELDKNNDKNNDKDKEYKQSYIGDSNIEKLLCKIDSSNTNLSESLTFKKIDTSNNNSKVNVFNSSDVNTNTSNVINNTNNKANTLNSNPNTPKIKNKNILQSNNDYIKSKVNYTNNVKVKNEKIISNTPKYDGNGNNLIIEKNNLNNQKNAKNDIIKSNSKKALPTKTDSKKEMSSSFIINKNSLKEKSQSFVENKLSKDQSSDVLKNLKSIKSPKTVNTKFINLDIHTAKIKNSNSNSMQFNSIK